MNKILRRYHFQKSKKFNVEALYWLKICWMRFVRKCTKIFIWHQRMILKILKFWIYHHVEIDPKSTKIFYRYLYKNQTNYSKIHGLITVYTTWTSWLLQNLFTCTKWVENYFVMHLYCNFARYVNNWIA